LTTGDWSQSPIPNHQSPIPNPQSPIYLSNIYKKVSYFYKINMILTLFFYLFFEEEKNVLF